MIPSRCTRAYWPLVLAVFSLASACQRSNETLPTEVSVLATVNGVPITDLDVALAAGRPRGHGADTAPVEEDRVLEALILQEAARQRAVEAGYDADADYRDELYRLQAQVNAFARTQLSRIYYDRELERLGGVSEDAARQYFEQNAEAFRSEYHVWQIFRRSRQLIEEDLQQLDRGDTFEQVAGKRFPETAPLDRDPWDLGYLKFVQMPDAWWDTLRELQVGETSRVIEGPNERYWIIRLVDRRNEPSIRFETVADKIREVLRNRNLARFQEQSNERLRENADIVYAGGQPDRSP